MVLGGSWFGFNSVDERVVEDGLGADDADGRPVRTVGSGLVVPDAVLPPLVLLHRLLAEELLMADIALERTVVAVSPLVNPQITLLSILLAANFAIEWSLPSVDDQVSLHGGRAHKLLSAYSAHRKQLWGAFFVA